MASIWHRWLLLTSCVFLPLLTVRSIPPRPPVTCADTGCTLYNSYGVWNDRKDCHVPSVAYPTTEEELVQSVAHASKNKLKVKVVSKFSHTIPKLACPDTGSDNSMLISTSNYDSGLEIDKAGLSATADAGMGLRELIDRVESKGLSLVAAPYWEGVSVGGAISTGAHGSSWRGAGGALHDHVVGISLVVSGSESEGYAKIVRIDAQNPLLGAAKVSLGMLGVISKVTFSLEPSFKRRVTYNFTDEAHLEDMYMDHGKKFEFGDITWYPSKKTAVYRYDDRVPSTTSGDGLYDFLGFQSTSILVSKSTRSSEKALESSRNSKGKCAMADVTLGYKKLIGNGLKNNGFLFTGYPVVGRQGKIQTSGSCLYSSSARIDVSCAWDPRINGLSFYETTAIFPAYRFGDFIRDVKNLRDLNPERFCGVDIYNGFLIRFVRASKALLGQPEDSVVLDFNYYRADDSSTPRLNQDVWEEVEQMAFFKYAARPHWAKNRNLAFLGVQSKYPNFNKFVAVRKQLDPLMLFSSEWSDQIFLGKEATKGDGCALEGQCVCSEDRHCSPRNGYLCKPGLVYKEARVCRYSGSSSATT